MSDAVGQRVEELVYGDQEPEPEPEPEKFSFMGFEVSASGALMGQLIQHQTQLDLVMDQLKDLHRWGDFATRCGCGLLQTECRTKPILDAYYRARRKARTS